VNDYGLQPTYGSWCVLVDDPPYLITYRLISRDDEKEWRLELQGFTDLPSIELGTPVREVYFQEGSLEYAIDVFEEYIKRLVVRLYGVNQSNNAQDRKPLVRQMRKLTDKEFRRDMDGGNFYLTRLSRNAVRKPLKMRDALLAAPERELEEGWEEFVGKVQPYNGQDLIRPGWVGHDPLD